MITVKEEKIVDAVSMAASFNSDQVNLIRFTGYAIQCVFSSTPVGTLKIQVSNDEMGVSAATSTWDDLDDSSYDITTAGSVTYNINQANYGKIRLVYTRSSGSGTFTAKLIAKNGG